jgi:thiol-disulfide isomerase/thioredoxin
MLLLALLLAAAPAATVRLQESGSAKVGGTAPSFGGWDLKGERVLTLEGMRRTPFLAPLLITFGASWCKPCIEGLPRLKAFSRKHPEMRLVLIDVESEAEKAQQLAARTGIDGPAILDKFEHIAKTYGVAGEQKTQLPRTFLVDAAGKVRAIYGVEGDDLEKVLEADLEAARIPVRPAADER